MFNRPLLTLALMTLSGTVLSAPLIVNLRINGSISPPTCILNGQTEETYTYEFNISPGLFPTSGNFPLNPQSQNIEVACDATTYLTFTSTDERAGTELVAGVNIYGLGTYNIDTKIGYYTVRMDNATVKTSADVSATRVGIQSSTYANAILVTKAQAIGWATSSGQLAAAQIFAANFTVTPTINGVIKNSAGDAELDGFAVLTFAFGL